MSAALGARAETLGDIVLYIQTQSGTYTGYLDTSREFVFNNTEPGSAPYSWSIPTVLAMMWAHHQGLGPKPQVTCGPAALALQAIYDRLGLYNKLIGVYTDVGTDLASHTYNEVINFDTGRWEAQDPYFGVHYVSGDRRLDTADLLLEDLSQVTPVSPRGTGWYENGVDHLRDFYFGLAVYHSRHEVPQWDHIAYNPLRFDIDLTYADRGQSFREYAAERYTGASIFPLKAP